MVRVTVFTLIVFLATTAVWGASTGGKHGDESSGHRSRHRRQGSQLYSPASYIIPGGEGSGAWGNWGEVSPCSRTCGGGVASQKRMCLKVGSDGTPLCTGGDTKYFSCQTQNCPPGTPDFKAQQCSAHDDEEISAGEKYKWVPYKEAPNPCNLNCMAVSGGFYYDHGKVIDGTLCDDMASNVCVNGICELAGCDKILGSNARKDRCGVCRCNNSVCNTVTSGDLDVCTLPLVTGDCPDYSEKWYYDTTYKSCRQYYYGCCAANGNNFNSEEECEARCVKPAIPTTLKP